MSAGMRNLHRLSGVANNMQAWADWNYYETELGKLGFSEIVAKHRPPEGASYRVVDKHIAALRKYFEDRRDQLNNASVNP